MQQQTNTKQTKPMHHKQKQTNKQTNILEINANKNAQNKNKHNANYYKSVQKQKINKPRNNNTQQKQ